MQTGRTWGLIALGVATALLAVGVLLARQGLSSLAQQRRDAANIEARLTAARQVLPEVQRREQYVQQALALSAQAKALGLDAGHWGERKVSRISGSITRRDAADLLQQISADGHQRLFIADGFDLAVLSRDAGVFTPPAADDKGYNLALSGTLYFPMTGGNR